MTAQDVLDAARARTGLSDLGDQSLLEGLGILLADYKSSARLTAAGENRLNDALVTAMSIRLRIENWLATHPELLDRPVEKPMFVFGLPRTGTTLTINLLNSDPARRSFLRWEAFDPVPPATPAELHAGPRYQHMQDQLDLAVQHVAHIAAMHYEDSDSPTECQFLMTPTFCSQVYESQAFVPAYRDWFLNRADYLPAFRFHKRYLQVLQANAPGRWTLKNPWHPLFLDALTTVYPDAQLVMTHRDPVEVVGSACSLVRAVRELYSDDVDAVALGQQTLELFDEMIARQDAYRTRFGQDAIFDIHYDTQLRDPIGEMRRLYDHFDEPLTQTAEQAMVDCLARNPKNKHGKHEYRLEDYGLSRQQVRAHFADYVERHQIPVRD